MLFHDDDDAPRMSLNGRQKLFIVAIDLAILAELCMAMSFATQHMDTFTPSFMKVFFSMFIPTLIAGFVGHRRLRDREEPRNATE